MARRRKLPNMINVKTVDGEALTLAGIINIAPSRDVRVALQELSEDKRYQVWNSLLACVENKRLIILAVDGKEPKKSLGKPIVLEHVVGEDIDVGDKKVLRGTNLTGEGGTGPVQPDTLTKKTDPVEEDPEINPVEEAETDEEVEKGTDPETPPAPPAPPVPPVEGGDTPDLTDL